MIKVRPILSLLLVLIAVPSIVLAHQIDEYLQATLVSVEPGDIRLKMNLTPGVVVAESLIVLMDNNRDGVISKDEAQAYAALLKRDLTVQLDQRTIDLKLAALKFPDPAELRSGWEIIQIEFSIPDR